MPSREPLIQAPPCREGERERAARKAGGVQARDKMPDLPCIELAERRPLLELHENVERAAVVLERAGREPALVLEALQPGFSELPLLGGMLHTVAASAPAVSSPMRRR